MRPRIRNVKPDIFHDEELWSLGEATGMPIYQGFQGLWCYADKEGRFEWRPLALKSLILPYWSGDFEALLDVLCRARMVIRYTVDGRSYGLVRSLRKHQATNVREPKSVLPPPPDVEVHVHDRALHVHARASPITENGSARAEHGGIGIGIGNGIGIGDGIGIGIGTRASEHPPQEHLEPEDAAPSPRVKFRQDWKPAKDAREYGRQLGLSDDEMRERAEHCRLKLYTHPFSTEDEQFRRELLWLRNDKETKQFREQRKPNPHGLDEHPGTHRRSDDPRAKPVFGRLGPG